MALATDLMGLGMASGLANLVGEGIASVTAAGTTQGAGTAITGSISIVTTGASDTAVVLPSAAPLGRPYIVFCNTATTAVVFPPTSGTIDNGSANASVNVAQNKARIFIRVSSTAWISLLTA